MTSRNQIGFFMIGGMSAILFVVLRALILESGEQQEISLTLAIVATVTLVITIAGLNINRVRLEKAILNAEGSYTCHYAGCEQSFPTIMRLHEHKKEFGHWLVSG